MYISKRIKVYLTEKGIQQKWLASEIGIDLDKLCQSLNGKRKLETGELSKIILELDELYAIVRKNGILQFPHLNITVFFVFGATFLSILFKYPLLT